MILKKNLEKKGATCGLFNRIVNKNFTRYYGTNQLPPLWIILWSAFFTVQFYDQKSSWSKVQF